MKQNYKYCIDRIINKYEGGYSNDKGDPGGPTRYGITYIDAAEYLHIPKSQAYGLMKTFPLGSAENIYSQKYEAGSRFDDLQSGVDFVAMDYDINSGLSRGSRVLQACCGLKQTGKLSDNDIMIINKKDPDVLIDQVCDERLHFMHGIKGGSMWNEFGKGWSARVLDTRTVGKQIAKNDNSHATADPTPVPSHGKATHIDPAPKSVIVKSGTGGVVASGATHVATGNHLLTGGLIVGSIVIAGVVYYLVVRSQKSAQTTVVLPSVVPITTAPKAA